MDREYYLKKEFKQYAIMIPSDKYKQGIEIMYPSNPMKSDNQIREHIKNVENIWVYVLPMPIRTEKVLGFKCETSYVKGLEYNLLKEYEEKIGKLPELNVMKK